MKECLSIPIIYRDVDPAELRGRNERMKEIYLANNKLFAAVSGRLSMVVLRCIT